MIPSPTLLLAHLRGARTCQYRSEGAASEAKALTIVAGRLCHVLNLEDTLRTILAGKGEVVGIFRAEGVFLAILLLDEGLAPKIGVVVVFVIEIHLAEHGLCGTLGGSTQVGIGIFRFVPEE